MKSDREAEVVHPFSMTVIETDGGGGNTMQGEPTSFHSLHLSLLSNGPAHIGIFFDDKLVPLG